jgi:alpha-beta hydrolase superfamily lysophospholipase
MTTAATKTTIKTRDGHSIPCFVWTTQEPSPRGVIQVLHGLGEHAERYARFAADANEHGWVVIAHDHRGHGAQSEHLGHYADDAGWQKIISDVLAVQAYAGQQFPGLRLVLLGHSMGSFIAQASLIEKADNVSAMILSGSAIGSRMQLRIARIIARFETWRHGKRAPSELMDKLNFQTFNKPFQPARTEFDWLSRDESEVDKYVADPLCGTVSSGQLWHDFLGGLLSIMSADAVSRIPHSLPILIMGGEKDPVGGEPGMQKLRHVYERTGHTKVTTKIYSGGRHEMLNEINRKAVTEDLLQWVDQALS